jgi:MFS family permease
MLQQGFHWLIVGLFIPVLILLLQSLGLSLSQVGLVMGAYVASTAILEIPLGGVADKYGRKRVYLCSLLVNIVGYTTLAYTTSFEGLIIAAGILGSARAIYSGTLDAWFYDEFQKTDGDMSYHDGVAKVNIALTLGLASGSLLGGVLPDIAHSIPYDFGTQFHINIIAVVLGNLLLTAITVLMIKETPISSTPTDTAHTESVLSKLQATRVLASSNVVIGRLLFTVFGCGIVLSCVENFWQPYLSNILLDERFGITVFGVITALYFGTSAISSYTSIFISRWFKQSHAHLLLVSRVLSGLALVLLGISSNLYSFGVFYLLFFYFLTVGNNAESTLLNNNTPDNIRSTMLSMVSVAVTVGAIFSSVIFGFVSEHFSVSISWFICGSLLIVSSLAFVRILRLSSLPDTVDIAH